jgi:hypothetical protein
VFPRIKRTARILLSICQIRSVDVQACAGACRRVQAHVGLRILFLYIECSACAARDCTDRQRQCTTQRSGARARQRRCVRVLVQSAMLYICACACACDDLRSRARARYCAGKAAAVNALNRVVYACCPAAANAGGNSLLRAFAIDAVDAGVCGRTVWHISHRTRRALLSYVQRAHVHVIAAAVGARAGPVIVAGAATAVLLIMDDGVVAAVGGCCASDACVVAVAAACAGVSSAGVRVVVMVSTAALAARRGGARARVTRALAGPSAPCSQLACSRAACTAAVVTGRLATITDIWWA